MRISIYFAYTIFAVATILFVYLFYKFIKFLNRSRGSLDQQNLFWSKANFWLAFTAAGLGILFTVIMGYNVTKPQIYPIREDGIITCDEEVNITTTSIFFKIYYTIGDYDPQNGTVYQGPFKLKKSDSEKIHIISKARFLFWWSDPSDVYYTVIDTDSPCDAPESPDADSLPTPPDIPSDNGSSPESSSSTSSQSEPPDNGESGDKTTSSPSLEPSSSILDNTPSSSISSDIDTYGENGDKPSSSSSEPVSSIPDNVPSSTSSNEDTYGGPDISAPPNEYAVIPKLESKVIFEGVPLQKQWVYVTTGYDHKGKEDYVVFLAYAPDVSVKYIAAAPGGTFNQNMDDEKLSFYNHTNYIDYRLGDSLDTEHKPSIPSITKWNYTGAAIPRTMELSEMKGYGTFIFFGFDENYKCIGRYLIYYSW